MDLAKIEDLTASSSDSSYAHLYWSDSSCLDLVTVSYPHHLPLYTSFPHNIQRIDACRYFILDMYGGIYADTDVSLHDFPSDKPFPDKLSNVLPSGVGLIEVRRASEDRRRSGRRGMGGELRTNEPAEHAL